MKYYNKIIKIRKWNAISELTRKIIIVEENMKAFKIIPKYYCTHEEETKNKMNRENNMTD